MNIRRFLLLLPLCAALMFCTVAATAHAQVKVRPAPTFENVKYGPHLRNVLDFWQAKSKKPTPLVVFIHGGGFRGGSKDQINVKVLKGLLKSGVSVAAINYRYIAQAPLPAAHYDARRALQFLRSKSKQWNIDKTRVGAFGGSAGAQICMYLGFHDDMANPKSDDPIERESTRLSCVATSGGQTTMDFDWWIKHVPGYTKPHRDPLRLFGVKSEEAYQKKLKEVSALSLISKDDPPIFMTYRMAPDDPIPANANKARGWKVHHVIFGVKLKEKMDQLGVEAVLQYPKAKTRYRSMLHFFKVKLMGKKSAQSKNTQSNRLWAYIGTYTRDKKSKGIYKVNFNQDTGKLGEVMLAAKSEDPSFLAIHPNNKYLYAVNEIASFAGKKNNGSLSAYSIDRKSGMLKLLNQKGTGGAIPCHVNVDAAGKHVMAANYTGGSACVYRILKNGKLGARTASVQHEGKSDANPKRQEKPHAHAIDLDPANRYVFVTDLGLDQVVIYKYDKTKGSLTPNEPPFVTFAPGAGPRHFAMHPSGRYAYVINELNSTVTALSYDSKQGALEKLQTLSTLPEDYDKYNSTAEIFVHPTGRFVYGSNRGHNSIAIFSVNQKTGMLKAMGHQGKNIDTPRSFGISPNGKYLIAASQGTHALVVFRINQKTGELLPTRITAEVPRPVCVMFYDPAR